MGLSSNVIWHQTKHEGIKAILSSMKFKCSYSLETIRYGKEEEIVAFPMISFCGIPIADTHEYLGKYGRYTIGLKRTWGEKKGLSYVWYREDKASTLFYQMKAFKRILDKDVMKLSTEDQLIWNLIAHTKNFQGKLERKKQKFDPYRFYDENEIRYVPLYQSLVSNKIKPILSMKEYEDYKGSADFSGGR